MDAYYEKYNALTVVTEVHKGSLFRFEKVYFLFIYLYIYIIYLLIYILGGGEMFKNFSIILNIEASELGFLMCHFSYSYSGQAMQFDSW